MTPVELNMIARAQTARLRETQELAQANNYTLAGMIRAMIWGKHAPGYEDFFPATQAAREQTPEQMFSTVRMLNRLMGGDDLL